MITDVISHTIYFSSIKITAVSGSRYLIGGNDLAIEGEFRWTDDVAVGTGYTNWVSMEPSNGGGVENCMTLFDDTHNSSPGKWNDVRCFTEEFAICEFKL